MKQTLSNWRKISKGKQTWIKRGQEHKYKRNENWVQIMFHSVAMHIKVMKQSKIIEENINYQTWFYKNEKSPKFFQTIQSINTMIE